jgi:23S rRNA (cytidine1920-2'-O)/16S rRNA (cytidine1409-2'-O)-methyltransferase
VARKRADLLLQARGLATSRTRAQELIRRGSVTSGGQIVERPGVLLDELAPLAVASDPGFVSRGGEKLDGALDTLRVDVSGAVVADLGASTGGFTDCVLRRGARRVHAVDVGRGQLDARLRVDPRVVSREQTNARHLTASDFDEPLDVVVVDASFISLGKLLPAIAAILPPGGTLVALVKPQFEVGPELARRTRGVVPRGEARDRAIANVREALARHGFDVVGECESALPGPRGNVEHFVHARRG